MWGGAGSERVEYIEGAVHTDRQPSTLLSTLRGLPPRCSSATHISTHTILCVAPLLHEPTVAVGQQAGVVQCDGSADQHQ